MMRASTRIALAAAAAVLALWGGPAEARAQHEHEDVAARELYMRRQRAFPNQDVPASAQQAVIAARVARGALSGAGAAGVRFSLVAGAAQWSALGPFSIFAQDGYYSSAPQTDAGRVVGVAFHPSDPTTWFIASASGGVWVTHNTGASWAPVTDNQCTLDMGAIAVDPKNPSIVYAGSGEMDSFTYGCGVMRSTTAGASWQTFPFTPSGCGILNGGIFSNSVGTVYIDPVTAGSATSTTVLITTPSGVFRSTNSGQNWTQVIHGSVYSVVANPANPGILFAGDNDFCSPSSRAVMRSADGGVTWTPLPLPAGVSVSSINRIQLATSMGAPSKVWMAVATPSSRLLGLYEWDDTQLAWTTLPAAGVYTGSDRGDFGGQANYDFVLTVDPADASRIYLGGVRLYRSTDSGATFTQIASNIHVDWHVLRADPENPKRLLAGSDGGVFLSLDGGDTWVSRNNGISVTQYYPGIATHPTVPSIVTGGSQDNGSQLSNGVPMWESVLGGDGGYSAINYLNPGIQWVEAQWQPGPAIFRRGLDGTFEERDGGISKNDNAAFIPPLIMSPITPTTLYFGTQRLWRTTNEGLLWVPYSSSAALAGNGQYITALAPSPVDSNTVYVGTSDGLIRRSSDGGVTFGGSGAGLPVRWVTHIAVDPANSLHAMATVSGSGSAHVWQSVDGGATWASISGTGAGVLPDVPVNVIVSIPSTGTLLVGTDAGIYQSPDSGTTWVAGPAGVPNVIINDLVYNANTQQVVAGTYGRGMWVLQLVPHAAVLRGDVNGDGVVDAHDALLVQQALVGLPLGNDAKGNPIIPLPSGDANCNGVLDTGDVLDILRAAVGLQTPGSCAGVTKRVAPARRP